MISATGWREIAILGELWLMSERMHASAFMCHVVFVLWRFKSNKAVNSLLELSSIRPPLHLAYMDRIIVD